MSTTPAKPNLWQRWLNFWFAPGDPTILGFIRLVTGFAVLYVHLAYCADLNSFFGKDGWYGLDFINRERREQPDVVPPFWGDAAWDEDRIKGAHIPEYPHRKAAVMAWLRVITADPAKADAIVRYVERSQRTGNDADSQGLLMYFQNLSREPAIRKAQLELLVNEDKRGKPGSKDYEIPTPPLLLSLPEPERKTVAKEIEDALAVMPTDPAERTFVHNYLIETDLRQRGDMAEFIRDVAKLDPAERAQRLDYMEYWNQEARYAIRQGSPIFSLWFHISDPTSMAIAHGVILVIILLFAIGLFTRVTSVLTWFAVVSYIHRNQQVLFGMDTMMNILLVYLMIGNSGAALSVDRLIARYRASRNSLRRCGQIDTATRAFLEKPPPSVSAAFAIRLLQVHFCFIYMAAGLSKLKGGAWWNTNAYWDTLVNPEFTMIYYNWYESLVKQLTQSRPIYQAAAAFGVLLTFAAEIGLPTLVWTRARPYVVILGLLLHAGVAVFMGLWIFSLLMMTMLLGYLPSCVIRERIFGTPSDDKLTVRVNRKSDRQSRVAALIASLDFDTQVTVMDGPSFAVDAGGRTVTGKDAVVALFQRLTWLKSFGWVLRVPVVGKAVTRALTGAEPVTATASRPNVPTAS